MRLTTKIVYKKKPAPASGRQKKPSTRLFYCRRCRIKMRGYRVRCPFCGGWSVNLGRLWLPVLLFAGPVVYLIVEFVRNHF
ncbi:MAG: hypothetical protein JSS81_23035 [Acidobacteria bacterium]|nr:hypothetical protein [Acidobacteriota bacterium]